MERKWGILIMKERWGSLSDAQKVYFGILALTALAQGLSGGVLSNYFKDAYQVSAYQRGLIEFPRELPGILVIFFVASLSAFSDLRIAMVAQLLALIGIGVLGVATPSYAVMLIFIFINSAGTHILMPVRDAIGMSLIEGKNYGKRMGQYKGTQTAFTMVAAILTFAGFRLGFFSFTTKVKWIFLVSAIIFFLGFLLYFVLERHLDEPIKSNKKINFVFRKEYKYYYILVVMWGVQKQIMLVYGPWVLIDLLQKKADTLAVLAILGALIGIFFLPALGRWIDRFGIKKLLYADAFSFIGVYVVYGFLSAGFASGRFTAFGIPVMIAYVIFILDKMSNQMGMIRTIYLRSIVVDTADIVPTLSLGLSMDHVVSITCAIAGGIVWDLWGPQYIFFLAASLSLVNVFVASKVEVKGLETDNKSA
jgi:MFS family permease